MDVERCDNRGRDPSGAGQRGSNESGCRFLFSVAAKAKQSSLRTRDLTTFVLLGVGRDRNTKDLHGYTLRKLYTKDFKSSKG